jgi:hypothetical protein
LDLYQTGRIPSGRQLDTLYLDNPSIYGGNIIFVGLLFKGIAQAIIHRVEMKRDESHCLIVSQCPYILELASDMCLVSVVVT